MKLRLKPYPGYKPSEQLWLGAVPKHWSVLPNRALFAEVKERDHPSEEMLSVTITRGVIKQKALLTDSSKKDSSNQDKSKYKLICPCDIAYNKVRAWQGAIGASDFRGIISPAYIVMRLREEQNARYFHHLYRTPHFAKEDGSIRILTMGNIQKGEVILPRSGGLDEVPDFLLLEHHDLLFTRTNGNPDLVGKVGIFRGQLSDKVSFASYLVRLRIKHPHDPQWLHMVLNSAAFWPFARSHALVNLQTNLNSTRYGQFSVPVPPPPEQVRIVEWVGEESESLNAAIVRAEREIALIREYRTRLIADVVTGQLDVREAVQSLSEKVSAEPFEDKTDILPDELAESGEEVALAAEET